MAHLEIMGTDPRVAPAQPPRGASQGGAAADRGQPLLRHQRPLLGEQVHEETHKREEDCVPLPRCPGSSVLFSRVCCKPMINCPKEVTGGRKPKAAFGWWRSDKSALKDLDS